MYSYEDIESRSISKSEMVVNYTDAMELLYIYEMMSIQVLGWEGWLLLPDGDKTHSQKHQGTCDLSSLPLPSAYSLAKSTMMQAHTEDEAIPEVDGAKLYFCVSVSK
jgi:hypothetical protein